MRISMCVAVAVLAAVGTSPAAGQNRELEVVPGSPNIGYLCLCSDGTLAVYGGAAAPTCRGGATPSRTCPRGPLPVSRDGPAPDQCGTPGNPWQDVDPAAPCYAVCGSDARPWQNADPGAACHRPCGTREFPWQDTVPGAACYAACGSAERPWQTSDWTADCYDCGSARNPWQSDDASADCYRAGPREPEQCEPGHVRNPVSGECEPGPAPPELERCTALPEPHTWSGVRWSDGRVRFYRRSWPADHEEFVGGTHAFTASTVPGLRIVLTRTRRQHWFFNVEWPGHEGEVVRIGWEDVDSSSRGTHQSPPSDVRLDGSFGANRYPPRSSGSAPWVVGADWRIDFASPGGRFERGRVHRAGPSTGAYANRVLIWVNTAEGHACLYQSEQENYGGTVPSLCRFPFRGNDGGWSTSQIEFDRRGCRDNAIWPGVAPDGRPAPFPASCELSHWHRFVNRGGVSPPHTHEVRHGTGHAHRDAADPLRGERQRQWCPRPVASPPAFCALRHAHRRTADGRAVIHSHLVFHREQHRHVPEVGVGDRLEFSQPLRCS